MAIPYVDQTWVDGSGGGTPTSAARFNYMEAGIKAAHYMPAVHVTHNAAQGIASNVLTALAFNTERFDQAGNTSDTMHDTVTNNSRLTCRYAGIYLITGHAEWAASAASGNLQMNIRLNGTTTIARFVPVSLDVRDMGVTTVYSLAVNDYVELMVQQNTAGSVNISSGTYTPEFMMVRVA